MSRKLYYQLKSEKPSSYADPHHEIEKSKEDSTLKSYRNHHKPENYRRETEDDEMVKYMSNLPGYLEKGARNREKVLSVGVLDWTRLEQWQYNHNKHVSHRNSRSSTSSIPSSSVSTEGLSGQTSRGHGTCPSGQRAFHLSLQSHFMASPMQDHSSAVKLSRRSVENCQDFRDNHNSINKNSKYVRADDHLSQNQPDSNRLKGCDKKYLDPYIEKGSGIFPKEQLHDSASCAELEMCTQDGGLEKRAVLKEPNTDNVVQGKLRKSKPIDHVLPRDSPQYSHYRVPHMRTYLDQKSENYSRLSFSEMPKEFFHKDLNHGISRFSPFPDEPDCNNIRHRGSGCNAIDMESIKLPASTSSSPLSTFSSPLSVRMGVSPSKSRKAEERKQTMVKISSASGPLHGLNQNVTSEKPRSSSPFPRLSIRTGNTSKGSECKDGENVPHTSSLTALKSSSENMRGYSSSNIPGTNKPGDTSRSRSSPLRRLLDPLRKPKTAKSSHSFEPSQKDSMSIKKNSRSANGKFSTLQPDKEMDMDQRVVRNPVNTIDSSKDKKHISSMNQALLRIAVRNGQPLFTFAVDHTDSNILAATVKNLGASGKGECSCVYTFFSFKKVKKKNGSWMNQAGKSKGPDYIPHVVAQMKVSDFHYYDLTSQNCVDSSSKKEFVLFSVKLEQGDAEATDYQPNDELAAIVVKIPKAISFISDQHHSSYHTNSQDLTHATVVLPGGVHSLPSKGGPPSLIERWKSGGSCDCGGWDLACKLKILASENKTCRKPRSSKAYFEDQFDLFIQGNEQEHRPAFSFVPFKHGMYSIAFDSSLSLLQAFSICIALVDSKMPYELSGSRNSIEGKNPRETLLVQGEELKAFGKLEDIPASYVSYPPVSPVGRV